MSLTDLIPALKGHGRRRAIDKVEELRAENRRILTLLAGADDAFALLHQQLADTAAKQADAEMVVVCQQADIDDLRAENDGLRDQLAALRIKFGPQLAAEANANAITVPPAIRPVDGPEDEATAPIDVKPLWAALGIGPVTDPGRIGPDDDTQPIPAA
ncbi:hypothetical protein GCM10010293_39980 [Streptomyces griseoflavus]|uniref:hypothetical protein n=1 Tax=Streptomyces griseoflavus TaxID=35619 RepID=UPI00167C9224|nr:hypothetical protein [Streptomyces griseoflavus]GGV36622.1 hypothetical protein GCM10010293_39980 [Streptomyces griseoflavus]